MSERPISTNQVTLAYFSPTHTTTRVLDGIVCGLGAGSIKRIDLTPPAARTRPLPVVREGLALIGAPVYSGRIPLEAARRLRRLRAAGTPVVVVALYGNREYEDALLELRDIATEAGFVPVAGGAFIGEHSYDSAETPIATGRPDAADLEKAERFGAAIGRAVDGLESLEGLPLLQVPGDFPYRDRSNESKGTPTTLEDLCTRCGECVVACPMAAIDVGDPLSTDRDLCIFCSACVKICPTKARLWEHDVVRRVAEWLSQNYSARKEPEVYFGWRKAHAD
jgi:ferredoxin